MIRASFIALANTALLLSSLVLSGCDQLFEQPKEQITVKAQSKVNFEALLASSNLYAYSQMSEALNQAQILDSVITALLHHPNPASLEEAQKAWRNTYSAYLQVSFFSHFPRFEKPQYRENGDTYQAIEEQLDSWPIEAGYIDYLPMYPLSGIVNDMTLRINDESLLEQHGFSDMRFASVGFHPLEFLLFGENSTRSAKDFIPQENSMEVVDLDTKDKDPKATEEELREEAEQEEHNHDHEGSLEPQNHNRRREYVRVLSGLIVSNLQKLADRWEPAHGYYAKQWRQPQQEENSLYIYQGLVDTVHQELINKHMQTFLQQKELDDLRSPFSNTDSKNIHAVLMGINQLFMAENSFNSQIKHRNAEVADNISAQFKRLLRDSKKLPNDLAKLSLKKRQKTLARVHKRLINLLEQLYAGAAILELELKALPVSTS